MIVNYFLSPYAALTQNMVAKIYEVSTAGIVAEVDSITIPERDGSGVPTPGAGHQVPYAVSFTGLDKVTHELRLYTAGGTLLHRYDVMPTADTITIFDPIRFVIGDAGPYTPIAGTVNFLCTAMAGLVANDYIAFRTGYGPVLEGRHIQNNILGGFDLIQPGDVFSGDPAEEWTIIMQPKVLTSFVNDSVVGKQWGETSALADMFVDVSSETTYVPAHLRKLIRLAGGSAKYKFESSDVPPVGYIFRITNFGAYTPGDPDPTVEFNNAPLLWGNTTKTSFAIPLYGTAEFVWDGTSWNCTMTNAIGDAGTILIRHAAIVNIGNVVYENVVTVTIPDQGSTNYKVLGSLRQNTSYGNVDVSWTTKDHTATGFKVVVDEWATNTQDLKFDFVIVR